MRCLMPQVRGHIDIAGDFLHFALGSCEEYNAVTNYTLLPPTCTPPYSSNPQLSLSL